MKSSIETFISKIDKSLSLFNQGSISSDSLLNLQIELKESISQNPETGKALGKYYSIINKAIQSKETAIALVLFPLLNGAVSIGHKPGGKISYKTLQNNGITTILTLLNQNEGALLIGKDAKKAGLNWIWFPFSASNPLQGEDLKKAWDLYAQLKKELEAGGKIYIHCSAGIHRTGMIAYGLLRFLGYDTAVSTEILLKLRPVTAVQVGEERLKWGDIFKTSK